MSQTKLYVGNLPFSATNNDLSSLFADCGEVTEVNIIMDRETNRSRGFAFVSFSTEEAAKKGAELNGTELGGRALKINLAHDDRRGGGNGGGRARY